MTRLSRELLWAIYTGDAETAGRLLRDADQEVVDEAYECLLLDVLAQGVQASDDHLQIAIYLKQVGARPPSSEVLDGWTERLRAVDFSTGPESAIRRIGRC